MNTENLPRTLSSVQWLIYRLSRGPNGHALLGAQYEATIMPKALKESLDIIAPGIGHRIDAINDGKLLEFQLS